MSARDARADRIVTLGVRLGFWSALAVASWMAFTPSPPDAVAGISDLVQHALAFATLAFLFLLAHGSKAPDAGGDSGGWSEGRVAPIARAGVTLLAYGIAIELVQSRIPERSAEAKDVLVDLLGIALGLLLATACADRCRRLLADGVTLALGRVGRS